MTYIGSLMRIKRLITTVSLDLYLLAPKIYTITPGIRALPNIGSNTSFDGGINSAILRYAGAADVEPTSNQTASTNPLVETNLHVRMFSVF